MFLRIRSLHLRGLIHGDIKPNNFLMGIGPCQHICFLVDFGLTKAFRIRDGNKWRHISFKKGNGLIGTAKYASVNSHNGWELSRRDDLESLGYVIIELINQELPWKVSHHYCSFSIFYKCFSSFFSTVV
uniref:non-specific serine/threonine protein kinase n=1 Tax=Syphacia muris TaxID=451379 RepID=A0A0N5AG96_9BILA